MPVSLPPHQWDLLLRCPLFQACPEALVRDVLARSGCSVEDFSSASRSDLDKYAAYFGEMLARGVYLAPAQFEAMFVSYAHTRGDIDQTVQAAGEAFARLYR